ncbi:hypothetical protein EVAR_103938_1 [Eumeta japonica]|uniref:Uncharacterized protein n=1 Tax=Eumeta variegata TaxID=151549 RepID=A0A4C1YGU4_EUMVA|nr:hypothetical protein EVAR_103938_1 [Eumeta japonica]
MSEDNRTVFYVGKVSSLKSSKHCMVGHIHRWCCIYVRRSNKPVVVKRKLYRRRYCELRTGPQLRRWPVGSFGSFNIDSGTAHPIPTYPFPPVHIPIACTRFPVQLDRNCLRYVACIERSILCFYPATEDYDFS